jgi:hypothetical protein
VGRFLTTFGMQIFVLSTSGRCREFSFARAAVRLGLLFAVVFCCGCTQCCHRATPVRDFFWGMICGDCGVCQACGDPQCGGDCADDYYADTGEGESVESDYYGSPSWPSSPYIDGDRERLPPGNPEQLPPGERMPAHGSIVPEGFFSWLGRSRATSPSQTDRDRASPSDRATADPLAPDPLAKDAEDRVYPLRRVVISRSSS